MLKRIRIQEDLINDIAVKYYAKNNIYTAECSTGTGKTKVLLESAKRILEKKEESIIISTSNNTLVRSFLEENKKHNILPESKIEILVGASHYVDKEEVLRPYFLEDNNLDKDEILEWFSRFDQTPLVTDFINHFGINPVYTELINLDSSKLEKDSPFKIRNRIKALIKEPKIYITNHFFFLSMYRSCHLEMLMMAGKSSTNSYFDYVEDELEKQIDNIEAIRYVDVLIDEMHELNSASTLLNTSDFSLQTASKNLSFLSCRPDVSQAFRKACLSVYYELRNLRHDIIERSDIKEQECVDRLMNLKKTIVKKKVIAGLSHLIKKKVLSPETRRNAKALMKQLKELYDISSKNGTKYVTMKFSLTKKYPIISLLKANPVKKLREEFWAFNSSFVAGVSGTFVISEDTSFHENKWSFERIGLKQYELTGYLNNKHLEWNKRITSCFRFEVKDRIFSRNQAKYYIFEKQELLPPKYIEGNAKHNEREENKHLTAICNNLPMVLNKNTLLLMSSYSNCEKVANFIEQNKGMFLDYDVVYANRDESMKETLEKYKNLVDSGKKVLLIGNLSYYTGIDLPKEYITTLVFGKLPFEPKTKGMSFDDQLAKAVLTFRQGLGRGLRSEDDEVFIAIMDPRVASSSDRYGVFRYFLDQTAGEILNAA